MSEYYNSQRTKGLYDPKSGEPFKLSRSKIDLFLSCPRCFYLDRRLGVGRPPGFPFNLNKAVDTLLKKEFDIHRAKNEAHPLMDEYKIKAVPFAHERIDEWRNKGIAFLHQPTKFLVYGLVDDLWQNTRNELIIVDYKATSKAGDVSLDEDWQIGYKRQMEIYQWLFRKNGFKVAEVGYFVYVNGRTDCEAFDGRLEFDVKLIAYKGDDGWVDGALADARRCLMSNKIPNASPDCDYCRYVEATNKFR